MRVKNIWLLGALTALLVGCVAAPEGEDQSAMTESAPEEPTTEVMPEPEGPPVVSEAFATPWPTGFTRRELADSALAKTYEYLDQREQGAHESILTVVHQDNVAQFHRDFGEDLAQVTVDAFSPYVADDVLLVMGTNIDFLEETLEELGRPYQSDAFPQTGTTCVAWQGTAWISMPGVFGDNAMPGDPHLSACVPHEIFHIAQDTLDKAVYGEESQSCADEKFRPLWLVEGSAQFMGHAVVSYQGYHEYWGNHFTAGSVDLEGPRPLLSAVEPWESGWDAYKWGGLATEYIIASVGVEPLMAIWAKAGQCVPFEQGFEEALGISLADFYTAFDGMAESMVFG